MLLNLSNHPSTRWTEEQMNTAIEQYSRIKDLFFPNIPPELGSEGLEELVDQYLQKIQKENPKAVHLMGEMTFTYRLVTKLKEAGIPCIASTTNRIVEEKDGKKIVQFQFVQFREY
ncbi:MAG: CRISPR-associated protein [Bacteroidetes bacterium]|jgi:hypothetical protein|nr:CRISPR-associated protein [Bacteroidota bacterium]